MERRSETWTLWRIIKVVFKVILAIFILKITFAAILSALILYS